MAPGTFNEFEVPTANSLPVALVTGADRKLWFVQNGNGAIVPMGEHGAFGEAFTVPNAKYLVEIAATANGDIWFTEGDGNRIGRIAGGVLTMYSIPTPGSAPRDIAAGPDGNIWFAQNGSASIGRLNTLSGEIAEFSTPTPNSGPYGITVGPEGTLWFTEAMSNKIGRIAPSGTISEFAVPTPNSMPIGVAVDADGNVWFAEKNASKIGRFRR